MVDLSKYMSKGNKRSKKSNPVHYVKFERDSNKRELEDWEIRAYDIIHRLMTREHFTTDDIKQMIYDHLLDEIGEDMGI